SRVKGPSRARIPPGVPAVKDPRPRRVRNPRPAANCLVARPPAVYDEYHVGPTARTRHHPNSRRPTVTQPTSRPDFLTPSTTLAGASLLLPNLTPAAHAAGGDVLKVGLIGCGGRGTGAASQALRADSNVKLTAIGDMFPDKLRTCLNQLKRDEELTRKI